MTKIPTNTVKFVLTIDQDSGGIDIEAECNFSATMAEDQREYFENVLEGLISKLKTEPDSFAREGYFLSEIHTLRSVIDDGDWEDDDSGFSIEFEPADDLLDKITEKKNGSKVVLFNGKKLH
jgi:hypothetical protein|tara:strand:+ start:67 stop:432 length:366 start_codon:yes stop_codon:yes gene_type:complete